MAGLGLQGAYGASAVQEGLRNRIIDQLKQQQAQQQMAMQAQEMQLRQQQEGRIAQEHTWTMQDRRAGAAERAGAAHDAEANTAMGNVGIGNAVEPQDFAKTYAGTPSAANFTPERSLPSQQMGGAMPLPAGGTGSPDVAAGQSGTQAPNEAGAATVQDAPRMATGRLLSMGTEPQRQTAQKQFYLRGLMTNPNVSPREKMALEYEQSTGKNPPAGVFEKAAAAGQIHDTANGLVRIGEDNSITPLNVKGYHPPVQAAADKLVKVTHRDPETGKTVDEWLPQSAILGQKFEHGASATTETRLASAQAVNQTGDDIIAKLSDPKVIATVGPAMGRASKLSDLMGNPPPEFTELRAMIDSYALATMGVHGMRSSVAADKIKQLMDGHHTPESLIAAVKGLSQFSNHFMENEGRKPGGGDTKKPTAEELIKKYGG